MGTFRHGEVELAYDEEYAGALRSMPTPAGHVVPADAPDRFSERLTAFLHGLR